MTQPIRHLYLVVSKTNNYSFFNWMQLTLDKTIGIFVKKNLVFFSLNF